MESLAKLLGSLAFAVVIGYAIGFQSWTVLLGFVGLFIFGGLIWMLWIDQTGFQIYIALCVCTMAGILLRMYSHAYIHLMYILARR
ncbi:MAG TPA: hypothetical protein VFX17_01460 [Patescibacteria group bacterium]|nr:hypothetical protein [Patescibacteria group bacterium]